MHCPDLTVLAMTLDRTIAHACGYTVHQGTAKLAQIWQMCTQLTSLDLDGSVPRSNGSALYKALQHLTRVCALHV